MIYSFRTATAAVLLGSFCAASQAITVDFNDLTTAVSGATKAGTGGNLLAGSVYTGGGLTFASDSDLQRWGANDPENADPGQATLYKSEVAPPLLVTLTAGGKFDLVSLQLAEADNSILGAAVTLSYTNDIGTFSQTLTVPTVAGLHTYVLNQPGLTSFSLGDVDYQLDNVVYNTPAIPEPGTLGMLVAGLLVISAFRYPRIRT